MTIKDALLLSLVERLAADGGTPSPDDITLAWLTIMRKFTPLIGASSVLLLFERSLDDHRADFPWLPVLVLALPAQPDSAVDAMCASMTMRASREILAAHRAILAHFIDLITTLIGTRLTLQFLRAAFPADEANSNSEEKPE